MPVVPRQNSLSGGVKKRWRGKFPSPARGQQAVRRLQEARLKFPGTRYHINTTDQAGSRRPSLSVGRPAPRPGSCVGHQEELSPSSRRWRPRAGEKAALLHTTLRLPSVRAPCARGSGVRSAREVALCSNRGVRGWSHPSSRARKIPQMTSSTTPSHTRTRHAINGAPVYGFRKLGHV